MPQLHEAWPGLTRAASKAMAGAARSVPNVELVTVASEPRAMRRHGEVSVPSVSAIKPPLVKTSAGIGLPMLYLPSVESCARREACQLPSILASEMASQLAPVLNNAGNTHPASVGDLVPAGMSIW